MEVSLQFVIWVRTGAVPLFQSPNLTVLVPWVDPNPLPLIVTGVPEIPDVGDRLEMTGDAARTGTQAAKRMKTETRNATM
jgi:hypothetical protein